MRLSSYIDHTLLSNTASIKQLEQCCAEALEYEFYSVCVPPYFVKIAHNLLKNSAIKVTTVVGFPLGYSSIFAKISEINEYLPFVDEFDVVANILAIKNDNWQYLHHEISEISKICQPKILKIIIETGSLTNEEIITMCKLCSNYSVNFMKTSTGFSPNGASIQAVTLMKSILPSTIQIKASGGIKNKEDALNFIKAGATRLGTSKSIALLQH